MFWNNYIDYKYLIMKVLKSLTRRRCTTWKDNEIQELWGQDGCWCAVNKLAWWCSRIECFASFMLCAPPPNAPDIVLLLWMCLTRRISCSSLHMWTAKSGGCCSGVHIWKNGLRLWFCVSGLLLSCHSMNLWRSGLFSFNWHQVLAHVGNYYSYC